MSAKEMFEKLGYRLVEVENPVTGEIYEYNIQYEKFDGSFYQQILFNNATKLMHTSCKLFNTTIDFTCYTPELLQAINKQVEELGWNNGVASEFEFPVEEYKNGYFKLSEENDKYSIKLHKYKTQQKEFIKYLEDEIKTLEKDILETIDDMDKYMKEVKSLIIEEILQK